MQIESFPFRPDQNDQEMNEVLVLRKYSFTLTMHASQVQIPRTWKTNQKRPVGIVGVHDARSIIRLDPKIWRN